MCISIISYLFLIPLGASIGWFVYLSVGLSVGLSYTKISQQILKHLLPIKGCN